MKLKFYDYIDHDFVDCSGCFTFGKHCFVLLPDGTLLVGQNIRYHGAVLYIHRQMQGQPDDYRVFVAGHLVYETMVDYRGPVVVAGTIGFVGEEQETVVVELDTELNQTATETEKAPLAEEIRTLLQHEWDEYLRQQAKEEVVA